MIQSYQKDYSTTYNMNYQCKICKDDGKCKNNETSKSYDDFYSDYWDCVEYIEVKDGKQKGTTMLEWIKRSSTKDKEYISSFSKWSKSVSNG